MKPKIQLLKALESIKDILVETLEDSDLKSIRPREDEELESRKKVLRDTFNRTARPSDDNEDEEEEERPKPELLERSRLKERRPSGKVIPFRPLAAARSVEDDILRLDIDDSGKMTREERMKVIDVIDKIDKQIEFLVMKKKDLMQEYGIVGDDGSSLAPDDEGFP